MSTSVRSGAGDFARPVNRRFPPQSGSSTTSKSQSNERRTGTHGRQEREEQPRAPWNPDLLWKRIRFASRILLATAVLAVGAIAAVSARRYVTTSSRFGLRDLRIDGNKRRSAERIGQVAGVKLGQNVVDLDLEIARNKLEQDPWIERATLSRRLPASVSIEIVEREAASMVALSNGTFLATHQGELFKKIEEGDPIDLPIVTGISQDDAGGDRESTAQLIRRALDLGTEIERVGLLGGRVDELHVEVDGGITAALGKRGIRVAFGLGPYRPKVRMAAKIEAELGRRSARPTTIFLDDDQHPDRVVVRLVSALPGAQVTIDGDPSTQGKLP